MGIWSKLTRRKNHPPDEALKLGRNDPCWCGSQKKYKKCHYDSDRKYFSSMLAGTCKAPG